MNNAIQRFLQDEEGLTIVEYAVAGGLITLGVVAAFIALGTAVNTRITDLTTAVNSTR